MRRSSFFSKWKNGNFNSQLKAGRGQVGRPKVEELEPRLTPSNVDVLQFHYDHNLSGWNNQETDLTPQNVNSASFGKLFSHAVDGYVYANVLYKGQVTIPGKGVHNVAFVSTEHDSIYAFDADDNQGANAAPLWQRSFINPTAGVTTVPQPDVISGDIVPEIGITGAPVIDSASNTMYVVVKTKEIVSNVAHYVQRLHAVDITTGQDRAANGAVTIGDTTIGGPDGGYTDNTALVVAGGGAGHDASNMVRFNALRESDRSSLTLVNGVVYIAYASHGDNGPYHGWVIGYQASDLSLQRFFNTSPNAGAGGIWQSEGGIAADSQGNLYFATGNTFSGPRPGFSPADGNYGETVLKLSATGQLTVADYFTPFDWQNLDNGDQDLGSGGTMLLPDAVGSTAHPHLMVETGKTGKLYLIDRDRMGHETPGGPDNVVQILQAGVAGVWGNPSFFQVNSNTGYIYYHGSGSQIIAVQISNGVMTGVVSRGAQTFGFPGGQPIISSSGSTNAIAWDLRTDNYGSTTGTATLWAYNATNLTQVLYNSDQIGLRDRVGGSVKFTAPTVTNGHVFVAEQFTFDVYGLFPTHATAPTAPTGLTASGISGSQITLTWTNPNPNLGNYIKIERSTNPTTGFQEVADVNRFDSTYTDGGLQPGTTYYYRIRATNEKGDSPYSNTTNGNTRIAAPVLAAANVTRTEIDIAWSPSGNDHYQIERSFNGGAFTIIANNLLPTQTTYSDTSTTQQGSYQYRVTAFNQNPTDSAVSNTITVSNAPIIIDHSNDFNSHTDLTANGNAHFVAPLLQLTDGGTGEASTAFSNQRVGIGSFSTFFTIRIHEGSNPRADGMSFIIQGNSPNALGGAGGGLGYGPDAPDPTHMNKGIRNSIAIKIDLYDNAGEGNNSTGLFTDGRSPTVREPGLPDNIPDGSVPVDPNVINFNDQHTKRIQLDYDGTTLTETILDLTTMTTFRHSYVVNIPAFVGTNTAYVGFGGGTGGLTAIQDVLTWNFTPGVGVPGAPTNLTTTSVGANDVNISWHSNSINETGFIVERAANESGNFVEVGRTDSPRFHDINLPPGNYAYRVRAYNDAGNSNYTNLTSAVIGPATLIDHATGFGTNTDLTKNGNANFVGPLARLTDGGASEAASIWSRTQVGVFSWTTSFTLHDQSVQGSADSVSFVLQNDGAGLSALGNGGGGGGYANIHNSIAIKFDLYDHGDHLNSTGLFMNGQDPSSDRTKDVAMSAAGITLSSGHLFRIDLAYDGTQLVLNETVTDTVTGAVFQHAYTNVNLLQIIGGPLAYAGFTGGTGGETSIQDVVSWTGRFLNPVQPVNHLTLVSAATTVAGSPIQLTVTARDGFNNIKADYTGTVHFTITDGQTTVPLDYTFTAADHGVHVFSNIILKTAGSQTITLTDTVTGYITGSQTVTVTPAAASLFVLGGFPTTITAGVQGTFTVTAQDPYGNTATGYTGTVTFSSTDPQAMLPDSATLTNGVGTFNATLKTAGAQSITAQDGTLTGSQINITVTPAATSNFLVAGFLTPTNAGDIHTFVVTAKDPYGNTTPSFQGLVHFSSTDPLALLEDDFTFTAADNGIHYSGAVLYTAGIQQISVTFAGGQLFGSQDNILVVPLAASTLTVFGYPSPVRPGVPSIITVIAQDRYGNTAPTYLGTITFSTSDPGGFLPQDYTFTPGDNGVHQFAAVLVTPGLQTITATDTADGTILGTQEVLVVLPATRLFINAPTNVPVGTPFQITVSAMADDGNADALYTGTVHFSVTDPLGMLPPDYTFTADDGGVHTFTIILGTEGVQTLTANDGNFQSSVDIEVDPAGAPGRPGSGQNGLLWQALVAPTQSAAAPIATADTAAATPVAIASDEEGPISASSLARTYHLNQAQRDPVSTDLVDLVLGNGTDRLSFGSTDEFFSRLI